MIIYITMMIWILLVCSLGRKHEEFVPTTGRYEWRSSYITMFLAMFYVVFFIGLRSAGADTHAYISSFQSASIGFDSIFQVFGEEYASTKSPGFDALEILIKTIFGTNYHVWLFFLALISGMSVAKTLRKNTPYFTDAMMLFMLMGIYGWMINGVRQFVAVSLSFAAVDKIVERRWKSYIVTILLLSTIHSSALVFIPVYFIVRGEAWNKKTLLLIFAGVFAITLTSLTTNIWEDVMDVSGYSKDLYETDDGSNVIRTLIYAVPPVLAYLYRDTIRLQATPLINVCINMSIVAVVLSMIANVTSGILVGRMPIYFSIYNLILLPWILYHIPNRKTGKSLYFLMYVFYIALWFYEGTVYYYSDLLFGGAVIY